MKLPVTLMSARYRPATAPIQKWIWNNTLCSHKFWGCLTHCRHPLSLSSRSSPLGLESLDHSRQVPGSLPAHWEFRCAGGLETIAGPHRGEAAAMMRCELLEATQTGIPRKTCSTVLTSPAENPTSLWNIPPIDAAAPRQMSFRTR